MRVVVEETEDPERHRAASIGFGGGAFAHALTERSQKRSDQGVVFRGVLHQERVGLPVEPREMLRADFDAHQRGPRDCFGGGRGGKGGAAPIKYVEHPKCAKQMR